MILIIFKFKLFIYWFEFESSRGLMVIQDVIICFWFDQVNILVKHIFSYRQVIFYGDLFSRFRQKQEIEVSSLCTRLVESLSDNSHQDSFIFEILAVSYL